MVRPGFLLVCLRYNEVEELLKSAMQAGHVLQDLLKSKMAAEVELFTS